MALPPKLHSLHERRAFLVRIWREGPQEPWRASVKPVAQDQEIHFSSPEKLFLFLHQQMADQPIDGANNSESDQAAVG